MSMNAFYSYQIGWYIFGTAVAFLAAVFFWNRGSSEVSGQSQLGLGLKLSGAGGIFVAVLLVFHLINPLKVVLDSKKIILFCWTEKPKTSASGDNVEYSLQSTKINEMDVKFDWEAVAVQMIPQEYIYNLSLRLEDKAFATNAPIPRGKYKIRFVSESTGKSKEFAVNVP